MNIYAKHFFKILNESIEEREAAEDMFPETDIDSLGASVGTEQSDYENEKQLQQSAQDALTQIQQQAVGKVESWIHSMEEFLDMLNGDHERSVNHILGNAEPNTLFDAMRQSEQRKISRVAAEVAPLIERFKGFVATAHNPAYKHQ